MSKKMPEYKRLFKQYKAGFFRKVEMTIEQRNLLLKHYPWLAASEEFPLEVNP